MDELNKKEIENHSDDVKKIINNMSLVKEFISEWQIYMNNIVEDMSSLAKLVKQYDIVKGDIRPINIEKQKNVINKIIEKHDMFVDDVENNKQRFEKIKSIINNLNE